MGVPTKSKYVCRVATIGAPAAKRKAEHRHCLRVVSVALQNNISSRNHGNVLVKRGSSVITTQKNDAIQGSARERRHENVKLDHC